MPGQHPAIHLQYLPLHQLELLRQGRKTRPRLGWNALLLALGDHREQSLNAIAADPSDDAELGQVGADRVDQRGPLPDEQLARSVQHQTDCWSTVLTGTKRIVGRVTASQIASASAASFLLRLTYGFT